MNVVLWIAAAFLALIVFAAGVQKLTTPYETLRVKRPWVEGFDPRFVRTLGALEVLGAIGLIVPAVTGIAPVLVPIAAACLAVLMVGAIAVEARRHPAVGHLVLPGLMLVLALSVAVGRGGLYPF